MSEPYVGEIRMFGGNFAPVGWMICQGQLLAISENPVLFNLIGTTYGGDGQNTFQLPDLRGRVPLHQGTFQDNYVIGAFFGFEQVSLTSNQVPAHAHGLPDSSAAASISVPTGSAVANTGNGMSIYQNAAPAAVAMSAAAVGPTGASAPHENRMPFLCVNFIISLFGVFPSQS